MGKKILSEAEKTILKGKTGGAALVLLDDLKHIRSIVAKQEPDPGDLRRMSSLLRRILVEGDLRKIAAPRLGKISIISPDLEALYRANEEEPFFLLAADSFKTHGISFATITVEKRSSARDLPGHDSSALLPLPLEPFQNQKVICYDGSWATRADVIKYVANVAHGVHSGSPLEPAHFLLRQIRQALTVKMAEIGPQGEIGPSIGFHPDVLASDDPAIEFRPDVIDVALLHLISTAQFLTTSPDVIALEHLISESG